MAQMYTNEKFDRMAIVSIHTGLMLTESFDEIHETLEALSGGPLFTHQLVQVQPFLAQLLEQEFPQLKDLELPEITPDRWLELKGEVDALIAEAFPEKEYFLPIHALSDLVDES